METILKTLGMMVVGAVLVVAISIVTSAIFMLAWNYVVPVFWSAAPVLTWLQSFAVVVLIAYFKPSQAIKTK